MPANISDSSNSEARHNRAKAMMKAELERSESGAMDPLDRKNKRHLPLENKGQETGPARAPRRSDGDRIDKVLAALAGKSPEVQRADGPEADRNAARDDERDEASSLDRGDQRAAFDIDDDDEADDEKRKPRKVKAKTLKDFATELEVKPSQIYDLEVEVADGDASPMTIGKLKDHYKATKDLDLKSQEFEDYRLQSQNEIIRGRNELDGVLGRIAEVVPQKDMEHILLGVRDQAVKAKASCQKELREYFPEWDDGDTRRAAGEKMAGWLKSYGLPAEMLGNLYDAKIIRMLWHMGNAAERYAKLRAGEREKRPSTEPRASRRKPAPTATETARERIHKGDKVGAVAALLMGKANGHDKS